jgi:hypothetical protein
VRQGQEALRRFLHFVVKLVLDVKGKRRRAVIYLQPANCYESVVST